MSNHPTEMNVFGSPTFLKQFEDGGKINLRAIELHLTERCNLGCGYCPYRGDAEKYYKPMNVEALRQIVAAINSSSLESVVVAGGGEPFVHPSIRELINTLDKPLGIITNGLALGRLTDDEWDRLSWISVSLHGVSRENFHRNTGKDLWDKVRENIKLIRRGSVSIFLDGDNEYDYRSLSELISELLEDTASAANPITVRMKGSDRHVKAVERTYQARSGSVSDRAVFIPSYVDTLNKGRLRVGVPTCIGKYMIPCVTPDGAVSCSCSVYPENPIESRMTDNVEGTVKAIQGGFDVDKRCIVPSQANSCYPYKYNKLHYDVVECSSRWL